MRWLLLADIHANLEALEAVLDHGSSWPDAGVIVAGDIVGYGPDPERCIEVLAARNANCIAGNHEGLILGRIDPWRCNFAGDRAARWTREILTPAATSWLAALPARRLVGRTMLVCHGDLDDCEHYVDRPERGRRVLNDLRARGYPATRVVCGHTHRAVCFHEGGSWDLPPTDVELRLETCKRYLINPGSVGQSRFEAPAARYARYDEEAGTLTFHVLSYDHQAVCKKLRRHGLVAQVSMPAASLFGRQVERVQSRWWAWRRKRDAARKHLDP